MQHNQWSGKTPLIIKLKFLVMYKGRPQVLTKGFDCYCVWTERHMFYTFTDMSFVLHFLLP